MNFTKKAHEILASRINCSDLVVDATMGKGFDTLFLSDLIGISGKVFAFDIQKEALLETSKRLDSFAKYKKNTFLFLESHSKIYDILKDEVKNNLKCAVFNLGYLPCFDKNIITLAGTTIEAMQGSLKLAAKDFFIVAICYVGHEKGFDEYQKVKSFLHSNFQKIDTFKDENNAKSPILMFAYEKIEQK